MKMKTSLSQIVALILLSGLVNALPMEEAENPYCYGYGPAYGTPDKLMKDDMDRIVEQKVGQSGLYLSRIDFYFEGKSYINAFWSDKEDEEFKEVSGWRHGASPYGT